MQEDLKKWEINEITKDGRREQGDKGGRAGTGQIFADEHDFLDYFCSISLNTHRHMTILRHR